MRWFLTRFLTAVVMTALVLVLMEGLLRLAGVGVSTRFFIPDPDRPDLRIENPYATRRYFGPGLERSPWPCRFPAEKPADEFRVFLLGESAALGDPIPEYGLAPMLQVLLQTSRTNRRVRVVNAAITAVSSHVIRDIAEEVAGYDPDAVVIYMGNNEVVGPYGPGTVFPTAFQHAGWIRFITWARGLRVSQVLEEAIVRFGPGGRKTWRGMEMFLDRQVSPDDPRLESMYGMFADNLEAICRSFTRREIPVVLSTVGVNLRDCAPLASEGAVDACREAYRFLHRGDAESAREQALAVLSNEGQVADAYYVLARALDELDRPVEARTAYRNALGADRLRFRADETINRAIRRFAGRVEGNGVTLVDGEALFLDASAPAVPGENLFYDHVHMNATAQAMLASALAPAVASAAGMRYDPPRENDPARAVGWTAWSRRDALVEMYGRRLRPPFAGQIDQQGVEARWADRIAGADRDYRREGLDGTIERVSTAAADHGASLPDIWQTLSRLWIEKGDAEAAGRAVDEVIRQWGYRPRLVTTRAALWAAEGRTDLGLELLRKQSRRKGRGEDQYLAEMARQLAGWGWLRAAENLYDRARERNPENADAMIALGTARAMTGDHEDAVRILTAGVALAPEDDVGWANLGRARFENGDHEKGIEALEEAVRLNPENAGAWSSLGIFLQRLGRFEHARRAMRQARLIDPLDVDLYVDAALLEIADNQWDEAIVLYRRAIRLSPLDSRLPVQLAETLQRAGRSGEAVDAYRKAIELGEDRADVWAGMALAAWESGQTNTSEHACMQIVKSEDALPAHRHLAGRILLVTGHEQDAIDQLRMALNAEPQREDWRRNLVWILSTFPDDRVCDGETALLLLDEQPMPMTPRWMLLDLRAAAVAAAGRFDEAQQIADEFDLTVVPLDFREAVSTRIESYLKQAPVIETAESFAP